jgi:thiol-disulfide isomerase/thioredoxin
MTLKSFLRATAFALAFALVCTTAMASSATPRKTEGGVEIIAVGADPILFTLKTLKGPDVKLEDLLQKKAVILVFWSLFCGPCQEELPLIDAIGRKYADKGLEVLAVNLDGEARGKAVEKFMDKRGYAFKVLWEQIDGVKYVVADAYGVAGTPTMIMINKKGKVSYTHIGVGTEEALEKAVQAALAE